MKLVTRMVQPKSDNSFRVPTERRGIEFNYRRTDYLYEPEKETGCLVFVRPHVVVFATRFSYIAHRSNDYLREDAVVKVGGKTLLRSLERMLAGDGDVSIDSFRMRLDTARSCSVVAPCGARARLTRLEVEKIAAALREELYPS